MAPSQDTIQKLVQARNEQYAKAFTSLSADEIVSWQSKDLVYNDPMIDKYLMTHSDSHASFTQNLASMTSMKIIEQSSFGTADFTTWEMLLEVLWGVDVPDLDIEKGDTETIRGVALLWWRWEGEGESWDGDLSDSEGKGIRGWKIVREHDYMVTLKEDSKGAEVRLFGK